MYITGILCGTVKHGEKIVYTIYEEGEISGYADINLLANMKVLLFGDKQYILIKYWYCNRENETFHCQTG